MGVVHLEPQRGEVVDESPVVAAVPVRKKPRLRVEQPFEGATDEDQRSAPVRVRWLVGGQGSDSGWLTERFPPL